MDRDGRAGKLAVRKVQDSSLELGRSFDGCHFLLDYREVCPIGLITRSKAVWCVERLAVFLVACELSKSQERHVAI